MNNKRFGGLSERFLALANQRHMVRAGDDDPIKDTGKKPDPDDKSKSKAKDASSEVKAPPPNKTAPPPADKPKPSPSPSPEENKEVEDFTDVVYSQILLVVDKRLLPLVEPTLHALATKLASSMKDGSYDEITRAVGSVRRELDAINQASKTIHTTIEKLDVKPA